MSSTTDFEFVIDSIAAIVTEDATRAALERLLANSERHRIHQALERMRRKVAYVTVLGLQGSGKSSLLNSLLFRTRTLPIGEGTTTNLITFVRGIIGDEQPHADVLLTTGEQTTIELTSIALSEYIDETRNPENRRGVASVICYTHHELLTNNTVFVDTPGLLAFVPQATKAALDSPHDSITHGFVREISLGVYVLRTTPPLRQAEADQLSAIWPLCPELVFVQNTWGETDLEVETAMRHNTAVLTKIARLHQREDPLTIHRVQVHEGLEGVTNDEPARVQASGLSALQTILRDRVRLGGRFLEIESSGTLIVHAIHTAVARGAQEVAAASLPADDSEKRKLNERIEEAKRTLSRATRTYRQRERTFRRACERVAIDAVADLRHEIEAIRGDTLADKSAPDFGQLERRLTHAISDGFVHARHRLAQTCDRFLEDAADVIDEVERAFAFTADEIKVTMRELLGTDIAHALGTLGTSASKIILTALTVISSTAFGTALAGGASLASAVVAAGAAVPGVGWAVALVAFG